MADFNMSGNDTPQEKNTSTNEKPTLLRVGITHGDTNGVGYEIILKAFAEQTMFEVCTPVVFGSAKIGSYHRKALGIETQFHFVNSAKDAVDGRLNLVNCFDNDVNVEFGRTSQEAGRAAYWALEAATEALKNGEIDVLVTAPICKNAIQSPDFNFAGHTEYLANRIGEGNEPLMVLANDVMRVALVTTHLPISEVAAAITKENVAKKIRQLNKSLQHDFLISAPRIAVLGLNPHNGDDGVMGHEEKEAIAPAVQEAVEQGIQCFGPYPADGFFGAGMFSHFDAVLAMYHDQGLAPFKALSMDNGVNITAGLPYVRTSLAATRLRKRLSARPSIRPLTSTATARLMMKHAKTRCRSSITSARKMATATDTSRLTLPLRAKRQCARMWRRRLNRLFDNYDL